VTPHHFRTKRQFWSYCGPGIVPRSSSDWVQTADGGWFKARSPDERSFYANRPAFIEVMRHAIGLNGSFFNAQRMVAQYAAKAYLG